MTPAAAWHTVTSPFGVTVLVIWAGLAALILAANARAPRKPTPQPDPVFRIVSLYPPEVPATVTPPFSQAIPDASWFDGLPVEILSDDAVRSLFDRLVDLDDNLRDLA